MGGREAVHAAIIRAALDAIVVMDQDGRVVDLNDAAQTMFGYPRSDAVGRPLADLIVPPALRQRHRRGLARYLRTGKPSVIGKRLELAAVRRGGQQFPVELIIAEIRSGRKRLFAGYLRDLTERNREAALSAGQSRILEIIASGAALEAALDAIVRHIEVGAPGMLASIMLLDDDGVHIRHGAARRLPSAFLRAIDGQPIGPRAGSCGTAIHRRKPVIVADIDTDPLWSDYRALAARHRLRACWSTPIFDQERRVLGSFAIYSRTPARPTARHLRLIERATHSAAIALVRDRARLERDRALAAMKESEAVFRSVFESAGIGMTLTDMDGRLVKCNPAFAKMLGYAESELAGRPFAELTHPEDAAENLRLYHALAAGDIDHFGMEKRYLCKDGGLVWVQLRVSRVPAEAGGKRFTIGMMEDITARRRAEERLRESERRFRMLAESSPDAILIHQDYRIVFANPAMLALLRARDAAELIGKPATAVLAPQFVEQARPRIEGLYAGAPQERTEQVYLRLDGTPVDVEIAAAAILLDGRPAAQVTVRDITARKQAHAALRDSERRFRGILEGMTVGFVALDRDLRFTYVNPRAEKILARSADTMVGRHYLEAFPEAAGSPFEDAYLRAMRERVSVHSEDFFPQWQRWFEQRVEPTPEGISVFFRDITERKRSESRIQHLATHDSLTDLPNRRLIHDRITQAISHARRTARQIAVLFVDLDRFKVINDGFGHPFGDALLCAAGERLGTVVRDGDTVARQSGDEFLVLLSDLRKSTDVYIVAQKIIEAFARPFRVQEREIHLLASIGIALFPQDGQSADALIGNADVAMYRAKALGGNTYQFFTREMSDETKQRVEIETELRAAPQRGELHLVYQPKVDLASGRIAGCEALVRWNHPRLGPVPPGRFIPIAEDSGLIVPIGDWVLRTACAQNKAWQDAGVPPVVVSVNLSPRQFVQQDAYAWAVAALRETGLAPQWLELELTESLIAQDVAKVTETVSRLKAHGLKLSIDDFGTGYSSLSYLKRFQVDALKIDQSFVRNMRSERDDATIVLAVISLAHSLRLQVIAEGVETAEDCDFLRRNGCDQIQGYFFSKPVPAAEFEAMLRAGKRLPNPVPA